MRTTIHSHLFGVYSALRARMNLINGSIGHALTQGEENEVEIRTLLTDCLPSSYGIGSGIIIDTEGNPTKQIDIIIFDKNRADYTLSSSSKIFLADHVIAAIEIKTTYRTGKDSSLAQGLANIASVKKLKVAEHPWIESNFNPTTQHLDFTQYVPSPPLGILFFFQAPATHSAVDLDQFFKTLKNAIDQVPAKYQPDLLFSLDHSAFFRHTDIGKHSHTSEEYSVCLVQIDEDKSQVVYIEGLGSDTKAVVDFSDLKFSSDAQIQSTRLQNTKATSCLHLMSGESFNLEPNIYRAVKIKNRIYLLDNFRAFLNFVWAVETILSMKHLSKAWSVTDYFGNNFVMSSNYLKDFKDE